MDERQDLDAIRTTLAALYATRASPLGETTPARGDIDRQIVWWQDQGRAAVEALANADPDAVDLVICSGCGADALPYHTCRCGTYCPY